MTKVLVYFLVVIGLSSAQNECKNNFLCTEDFCASNCAPKDCYIPNQECDGLLLELYDNPNDFCSCCPMRCVRFLEENASCTKTPSTAYPKEMCGYGLSCQTSGTTAHKCLPAKTTCMQELQDYNEALESGTLGMNETPPKCDEDGLYEPVQCTRGGLCRCVDRFTGNPTFGLTGSETEMSSSGQTCDCATHFYDSIKQGCRMAIGYYGNKFSEEFREKYERCLANDNYVAEDNYFFGHMRCLPNGNFDTIQCVTNDMEDEDFCFCIDKNLKLNSSLQYQSLTTNLHCFNEDIHEIDYFRPCEAIVKMKRDQRDFLKQNQSRVAYDGLADPKCTPDGFYHHVQVDPLNSTRLFCSDRHGNLIEDYEAKKGTKLGEMMNCECALARTYLSEGVPRPTCCSNGNYRRYQCQAGQCFCVDKYGRQTDKEYDQLEIQNLNCPATCGDEPEEPSTTTITTTTISTTSTA